MQVLSFLVWICCACVPFLAILQSHQAQAQTETQTPTETPTISSLLFPSCADDYVFLAPNDAKKERRAVELAIKQSTITYADLATAVPSMTAYPPGVYAKNISVPANVVGGYVLSEGSANLVIEVLVNQVQYTRLAQCTVNANITLNVLEDFKKIYTTCGWPYPDGLEGWSTDEHFCRMRKTFQPMHSRKITVGDLDVLAPYVSSLTLLQYKTWASLGLLFGANFDDILKKYNLTALNRAKVHVQFELFKTNPLGLTRDSRVTALGVLVNSQWVTPSDGAAWQLAKLATNSLNQNILSMHHFLYTHLQTAPVVFAMLRQMGQDHPIYQLLSNFKEYTWGLVNLGFTLIFNPGTNYDNMSMFSAQGMHNFINAAWSGKWTDQYLETEIASRGVGNLPDYDYLTDLRSWRGALNRFVVSFVDRYYSNDAAVRADTELQNTVAEISDPARGKIYGFPVMDTKFSLSEMITHLFMTVIQHHATNTRAIGEVGSVLLVSPSLILCEWPGKAAVTESYIVKNCMPNVAKAVLQPSTVYGYNRTFDASYSMRWMPKHTKAGNCLDGARTLLETEIKIIEAVIDSRPDSGPLPYKYLKPSAMPLSAFA